MTAAAEAEAEIAALIAEIPTRKAQLRQSYDLLLASASSPPDFFTLPWPDLEAHFSARELSIAAQFASLQSPPARTEPTPRPTLLALCTAMDANALRAILTANTKDATIFSELEPALRAAPDAASLVLDAMGGSLSTLRMQVACLELLERVRGIGAPVTEEVRGKARRMAAERRWTVHERGEVGWEVMWLLQLVAAYGLVGEYGKEELVDLVAAVSHHRKVAELIRCLGLVEELPDLIQKLSNAGKPLDAVKIVAALNLFDKFPPVPILKGYMEEINSVVQEARKKRKKGNNSIMSEEEATAKESRALRLVTQAIDEYNLESEYPRKTIEEQIARLKSEKHSKRKRERKKRKAAAVEQAQQLSQLKKHPRQRGKYISTSSRCPGGSGNRSPERYHVYSSRQFASDAGLYNIPATYNDKSLRGPISTWTPQSHLQ